MLTQRNTSLILVFFKSFSLINMSPILEALQSANGQYQTQLIHKEQKCLEWADNNNKVVILFNQFSVIWRYSLGSRYSNKAAVLLKAITNLISWDVTGYCGYIVNNRHFLSDQLDSSPPNSKQSLKAMSRNHPHLFQYPSQYRRVPTHKNHVPAKWILSMSLIIRRVIGRDRVRIMFFFFDKSLVPYWPQIIFCVDRKSIRSLCLTKKTPVNGLYRIIYQSVGLYMIFSHFFLIFRIVWNGGNRFESIVVVIFLLLNTCLKAALIPSFTIPYIRAQIKSRWRSEWKKKVNLFEICYKPPVRNKWFDKDSKLSKQCFPSLLNVPLM